MTGVVRKSAGPLERAGAARDRARSAYERAAAAHRRAAELEALAAGMLDRHGKAKAAARHRDLIARHHGLAGDDDDRARRLS